MYTRIYKLRMEFNALVHVHQAGKADLESAAEDQSYKWAAFKTRMVRHLDYQCF